MSSQPPETPEAEIPEQTKVHDTTESTEVKAAELLASMGLLFDTGVKVRTNEKSP